MKKDAFADVQHKARNEVRTFVFEHVESCIGVRANAIVKAAVARFGREKTMYREVDCALQHLSRAGKIEYSSDGWRPL